MEFFQPTGGFFSTKHEVLLDFQVMFTGIYWDFIETYFDTNWCFDFNEFHCISMGKSQWHTGVFTNQHRIFRWSGDTRDESLVIPRSLILFCCMNGNGQMNIDNPAKHQLLFAGSHPERFCSSLRCQVKMYLFQGLWFHGLAECLETRGWRVTRTQGSIMDPPEPGRTKWGLWGIPLHQATWSFSGTGGTSRHPQPFPWRQRQRLDMVRSGGGAIQDATQIDTARGRRIAVGRSLPSWCT